MVRHLVRHPAGQPEVPLLVADEDAAQNDEHHEDHDDDYEATQKQTEQFHWAKSSHNIVPNYWMEALAEIQCFSTD